MEEDRVALVVMLLKDGHTEEAVKLYQEEACVGYFEAKQMVDDLASRHGIRTKTFVPWAIVLFMLASFVGFLLSH